MEKPCWDYDYWLLNRVSHLIGGGLIFVQLHLFPRVEDYNCKLLEQKTKSNTYWSSHRDLGQDFATHAYVVPFMLLRV